jgi:hypothetical protein
MLNNKVTKDRPGIFDSLFNLPQGQFIEDYFPSEICIGEGELRRLDDVLQNSLDIADPGALFEGGGSVMSVFDSPLQGGVEMVSAIRSDLGFRNDQVIGAIACTLEGTGVPKHYDGNEVLTIQLVGSKEWQVAQPTEAILPNVCKGDREENISVKWKSIVLEKGSAAFLPRGWWHKTHAITPSISLNFEIRSDVWGNLFVDALYRQLCGYSEWLEPVRLSTPTQKLIARNKVSKLDEVFKRVVDSFQPNRLIDI